MRAKIRGAAIRRLGLRVPQRDRSLGDPQAEQRQQRPHHARDALQLLPPVPVEALALADADPRATLLEAEALLVALPVEPFDVEVVPLTLVAIPKAKLKAEFLLLCAHPGFDAAKPTNAPSANAVIRLRVMD